MEPLAACDLLKNSGPLFIRSVQRQAIWLEALNKNDANGAKELLISPDGIVSLWLVSSYHDLRSVALAINESRPHLYERLSLLSISRDELVSADVALEQTPGETRCALASSLHYDAEINPRQAEQLLILMLQTRRQMTRISVGMMKVALNRSGAEGCFAVVEDNANCRGCGASVSGDEGVRS